MIVAYVGTLPACGSLQVRLNNLGFRVTNRRLTSSTKTRDANKIRADPRQRKEKELGVEDPGLLLYCLLYVVVGFEVSRSSLYRCDR
jgi:hypothetical protein